MSRAANFLFIVACWVAIYLLALGSLEIKGEEGRRILPAVTMIETGNYLVPQIGSDPYFRKPPLVNWLVAISFQLTGHRNEWAARLPSALAVLAVAVAFITTARTSLGANGSLAAALVWLTSFGIIEKGRLIEIEALYVSLLGLALICWISAWYQRWSRWATWLVPSIFLGLGLLAKGPVHLLFFYSVVVAVLYRERHLRTLIDLPHLLGIAMMLGIFAAWAVPYWHTMRGTDLAETWSVQILGRLGPSDFKVGSWLLNIPRGLAYFLPWTLLLPLVSRARFEVERERNLFLGLLWGSALPFLLVNLLPSGLPRYSMPALPGAAWMMAMMMTRSDLRSPRWWPFLRLIMPRAGVTLVRRTAIVIVVAMVIYSAALVPLVLRGREKIRPIAAQIDALVPKSETLYAVDPDYQPFLFYTKSRLVYVDDLSQLPHDARYVLVQGDREQEVLDSKQWAPSRARSILTLTDYRKRTVVLAKVEL